MLLQRSRFNRSRPACGNTRSRARASSISSWRTDEPCGEKSEHRLRQLRAARDRVRGKWRRCRGATLERRNHFRGQCVRGCRQIRRSGRERGRCTRLAPGLRSGDSSVRHGTGGRCRSIASGDTGDRLVARRSGVYGIWRCASRSESSPRNERGQRSIWVSRSS